MNKKDFFIIVVGIIALAAIILIAVLSPPNIPEEVKVISEKTEYKMGDVIKLKIENNLKENLCFSSCYPYYFDRKDEDGQWKTYSYVDCPNSDLIESCVESRKVKAFEIAVPVLKQGPHRLVIPACIKCSINSLFREDQKFYSNEFEIK